MADAPAQAVIRIGPAGWSYPDWRGIVYPKRKPRGFHGLEYLAQFFDAVEINTTFYNPPRPGVVKGWIGQVEHNQNFTFTAKLWQGFTHDRNATPEDERAFKDGIAPLAKAGQLGALLLQFPWSFKHDPENRQYLADFCRRFREYPLVIEVRHSSWNKPEILEMLSELGVGFCNIDQPVIGRSIKPTENVTAPVGYVRLHGRNYKEWFTSNENPGQRYNYLYRREELDPWIERIRHIAQRSKVTFVITNNHARGKAVANALQLIALVTGRTVQAPESLLEEYTDLAQVATAAPATAIQPSLPLAKPDDPS
ncbi:MAG TPA: DUF72 domain-containing protein [Terriglobia bacterium]|nr:DUF72 domain-containing protein [Terriglobia bacterium]